MENIMSAREEELQFVKVKLAVLELPVDRIKQLISELSDVIDNTPRKRSRMIMDDDIDVNYKTSSSDIDAEQPLWVTKDQSGKYNLTKICKHGDEVFDVADPDNRATYTVNCLRHNETYEKFHSFSALLSPGKDIRKHIRILRQGIIYYLMSKNE